MYKCTNLFVTQTYFRISLYALPIPYTFLFSFYCLHFFLRTAPQNIRNIPFLRFSVSTKKTSFLYSLFNFSSHTYFFRLHFTLPSSSRPEPLFFRLVFPHRLPALTSSPFQNNTSFLSSSSSNPQYHRHCVYSYSPPTDRPCSYLFLFFSGFIFLPYCSLDLTDSDKLFSCYLYIMYAYTSSNSTSALVSSTKPVSSVFPSSSPPPSLPLSSPSSLSPKSRATHQSHVWSSQVQSIDPDLYVYASSVSSADLSPSPSTASDMSRATTPYYNSSQVHFNLHHLTQNQANHHNNQHQHQQHPTTSPSSCLASTLQTPYPPYPSSSAHITHSQLPPRPDSPRPALHNKEAIVQARLTQLVVWGDAAEDERFDACEDVANLSASLTPHAQSTNPSLSSTPTSTSPSPAVCPNVPLPVLSCHDHDSSDSSDDLPSVPPSPVACVHPRLRAPDRVSSPSDAAAPPLARRRSLFCPRPKETITRKPSLWARQSQQPSDISATNPAHPNVPSSDSRPTGSESTVAYPTRSFYYAPCPPPRRSSRRPQSFHRYARIVPGSRSDQPDRKQGRPELSNFRGDKSYRAVSRYASTNNHMEDGHAHNGSIQTLCNGARFGADEFDDLVDGLHATKVTETHLNPHS